MSETKSLEQLQDDNKKLQDALRKSEASAKKDLEAAMKMNAELQEKLEATKNAGGSKHPVVKVDGKDYQIVYPAALVNVEGKLEKKTAEQIAGDKKLCTELIEAGSKILKLIDKNKKNT